MTKKRDNHGRYKADHSKRNIAIGTATAVGAVATAVASALHFGLLDRLFPPSDGHAVPDLERDTHPGPDDRAVDAFRPDPTAAIPADEREALRPPKGFPVGESDRSSDPVTA